MAEKLRLLVLGAHPDDADIHAGGLMCLYRKLGHEVRIVSITNGDAGHHEMRGEPLAERRRAEAAAAGNVIGATYITWDNHDGMLQPTLDVRWQVIREIRTYRPHLVLTHRPNDYHPDHRAVGNVVRDASYMVTVPAVVPDVPIVQKHEEPVVAYMPDRFTKPYPLQPDAVLDTTPFIDQVVQMLHCHESQVYEWLPANQARTHEVPSGEAERLQWLRGWYLDRVRPFADRFRDRLIEVYGQDRGSKIEYCEAFEISEYAGAADDAALRRLFPIG
jgi:LmbE family N-acetylglucosaminyl deacetylase